MIRDISKLKKTDKIIVNVDMDDEESGDVIEVSEVVDYDTEIRNAYMARERWAIVDVDDICDQYEDSAPESTLDMIRDDDELKKALDEVNRILRKHVWYEMEGKLVLK